MVNEAEKGRIGAWGCSTMGRWRYADSAPSEGAGPCFLELSPDFSHLAIANYGSGSVALFELDRLTGRFGMRPALFQNTGHGQNADRQAGPHAHCVRFHKHWLYSTDLGTDQILAWDLSPGHRGLEKPTVAFETSPGEGPRHILFHPSLPIAYLLTELGSRIYVLDILPSGLLRSQNAFSTLPADFEGNSLGGHLSLDAAGRRLFASNRGHDSVAVFEVGPDGALTDRQIYPSFGRSPRHFLIAEDKGVIIIAHQNSQTADIVALDADSLPAGHVQSLKVPCPAFIGRISGGA